MEMLAYSEENRSVVIPWVLDPDHEDLDLEVDGCGCGCGDGGCGSCGCSCACSCSCSCACDDTGANGDDSDDFGASDSGGDTGSFVGNVMQCVVESAVNIAKSTTAELTAVVASKGFSAVNMAAIGAAANSMIDAAVETGQTSEACLAADRAITEAVSGVAEDLSNDESFAKATETLFAVH